MNFADKAINYFLKVQKSAGFLSGIEIRNPYKQKTIMRLVKEFYLKFFNDNNQRLFFLGINPGRFGGGLTGIAFTDPVALREQCGIENDLGNQKELSSKFIYKMIEECGSSKKFYSKIFVSAIYPLALIKDGKNYNYYDTRELAASLRSEIIKSIKSQIKFGARRDKVIILGKKNAEYFSSINDEYNFFENITALEHPRYIMQYKLKKIDFYISKYIEALD